MADGAPIAIGIAGALGRMGKVMAGAVGARGDMAVAARFARPGTEGQMLDGAKLVSADAALAASDVIIDFTLASASAALAARAAETGGVALVIGSTGFTPEEDAAVRAASARIAIVKTGNFSLGMNVLAGLVRQAAALLGPEDWDIEILEAHHRRKIDAPSGTALMLGDAAGAGRGVDASAVAVRGRDGVGSERPVGAIGYAAVRGGGIVGEHSVMFAAEDEIVTLSHSARDRNLFARGAVAAAAWVAGKPAGLYDMQDVLGFRG
jgi:4-hydroxy-tetrahydrodipicolinate reductase